MNKKHNYRRLHRRSDGFLCTVQFVETNSLNLKPAAENVKSDLLKARANASFALFIFCALQHHESNPQPLPDP
jgi:hypothetical protein